VVVTSVVGVGGSTGVARGRGGRSDEFKIPKTYDRCRVVVFVRRGGVGRVILELLLLGRRPHGEKNEFVWLQEILLLLVWRLEINAVGDMIDENASKGGFK